MSRFLRITRQGRWLNDTDDDKWLPPGETKADALRDLQTHENALSIYRADDESATNRICLAIAATRENLGHLDYATFDATELQSIGIEPSRIAGKTPDPEVNQLHYDLTMLTVEKVSQLARVIAAGDHNRIPKKSIESSLRAALQSDSLDRNGIKSKLLQKLENE